MDRELIKSKDQELIKGFIGGNEKCFEILLHRHKAKVFTTIYLIVKDKNVAEDLFQDTMIKVVRLVRAGKYNERGRFLPWVVCIARNLAIDYFRKAQRNPIQRENEEYDMFNYVRPQGQSPEENIIKKENARYVRKMIQQLPEKQREVLIMRTYSGLTFKEIAKITNVNINTALGRMRYALINLRRMIQESNTQSYEANVQRR